MIKRNTRFFHKPSISDYIPLKLPPLYINNKIIKRSEHIRFLGIILDENLTWKKHINTIESKIAKNIGALYRAKFLLFLSNGINLAATQLSIRLG